jgi:hypothetical protein
MQPNEHIKQLEPIDPSEFIAIIDYLNKYPDNTYEISLRDTLHPILLKILIEYAKKHVDIPFKSIEVTRNIHCEEHLDKGNTELSYIVGFGEYPEGGGLWICGYSYNIRYRPLLFKGSKEHHKTELWRGNRFTILFF